MPRKKSDKKTQDIEFLKSYQEKLHAVYAQGHALIKKEVFGWGEVLPPKTDSEISDEAKRCAELATCHGISGEPFLDVLPQCECTMGNVLQNIHTRIANITKIIDAIELRKNTQAIAMNDAADMSKKELIDIHELAQMLNLSESTLRNYDNEGDIPFPCGNRKKLLWRRTEIKDWIKAGRPKRVEWEKMKGTLK